jgi:hypothetical protein
MNQQKDPFCSKCKALVNTTATARARERESLAKFEREEASDMRLLPMEFQSLRAGNHSSYHRVS